MGGASQRSVTGTADHDRGRCHARRQLHGRVLGDVGQRRRLAHDQFAQYAERLEHYARKAPDNWFNFYDFWG